MKFSEHIKAVIKEEKDKCNLLDNSASIQNEKARQIWESPSKISEGGGLA